MYENVCSFDILIQVKSQNVGYQLGILTVRGERRVEEHLLLSHNGSYGDISRSWVNNVSFELVNNINEWSIYVYKV